MVSIRPIINNEQKTKLRCRQVDGANLHRFRDSDVAPREADVRVPTEKEESDGLRMYTAQV